MSNIFYTLISSQNYKKSRQDTLKKTWLKDVAAHYLFASDENTEDSVKFSAKKDYSSCEEKQLSSVNYLVSNKANYDWYFFGDDDTYVNTKNLNKLLETFKGDSVGFILSKLTDPRNDAFSRFNINHYYSGGAGFCFSRKLLFELKSRPFPPSIYYADISMTRWLGSRQLYHCPAFNPTNPMAMNHSKLHIKNAITYHYMDDSNMRQIYSFNSSNV